MEQHFQVDLATAPDRLFPVVADLGRYDQFLDIVHRVEPDPTSTGLDGRAWLVTLRAKLGPLARSKRLRMVQTVVDEPRRARFERAELDGRQHSSWVLEATVTPSGSGSGSTLTMMLDYSGGLWSAALEGLLQAQVDRAATRLEALTTAG